MAAGDFVKAAAAQLHRAAFALKQEAQSMLAERERRSREKAGWINHAELSLKAKQTSLYNPKDDQEKQRTVAEVGKLRQQIDSEKHALQQIAGELAQAADKKNSQAKNLDSRASDLESQAGSL